MLNMTIGDEILIMVGSYARGYALMRRKLHGKTGPATLSSLKTSLDVNEQTLSMLLSRLKSRGLLESKNRNWTVSKSGLEFIRNKIDTIIAGGNNFGHTKYADALRNRPKNMIIAFDIPERSRGKRQWLRSELTSLGFAAMQKSVWFGPAPLPREFIEAINTLKLIPCMKFFKASEQEIV